MSRQSDRNRANPNLRLIPKREVLARLGGVTYATLWSWMRLGQFPRSRQVGGRSMWVESEVNAWIASRPAVKLKGDAGASIKNAHHQRAAAASLAARAKRREAQS
jgi:predicted DNA-binding transcriptional regulator AlpA